MSTNEWKVKYFDLKQKFMDATDTAYRLGYEQGAKEIQMEMQAQQMAEQQAQQAAMQAGAAGVDEMGNPVDEMGNPIDPNQMSPEGQEGEIPPDVDPEVSQQLDDHINELESLVAKGEKPSVVDLRKAVQSLSKVRKSQKDQWGKQTKKKTSIQKSFVDNMLAKWEKESKDATADLEEQILKDGLKIED